MSGPHDWLEFAANDLRAAEIIVEEELYTPACFHA